MTIQSKAIKSYLSRIDSLIDSRSPKMPKSETLQERAEELFTWAVELEKRAHRVAKLGPVNRTIQERVSAYRTPQMPVSFERKAVIG